MRCVFASGGSGGHLFPSIALSKELVKYEVTLITDERGIKFLSNDHNFKKVIIHKLRSKNKRTSFVKMALSFIKCFLILKKTKPQFVMGFGGYPSVPCVMAARYLKIPILLHEQNVTFGKANSFLIKNAKLVFTSFKETEHKKAHHVGNFIRKDIEALFEDDYKISSNDKLNILIIGGSQGAKVFFEKLPSILKKIDKLVVHHQIGNNSFNSNLYNGIDATIKPFFHDMKEEYKWADIVIARGGSSTIFELALAKKPAIIIPLNDKLSHQKKNVEALKDAIILIEEDKIEEIGYVIETFLKNKWRLLDMSKRISEFAYPNASKKAVDVINEMF